MEYRDNLIIIEKGEILKNCWNISSFEHYQFIRKMETPISTIPITMHGYAALPTVTAGGREINRTRVGACLAARTQRFARTLSEFSIGLV